jgi:hypothetical protein
MTDDEMEGLEDGEAKEVVAISGDILAGKLDVLNGCARIATQLAGADTSADSDLEFIVSLHLASMHLPIGCDRPHWNAGILARKDQEIADLTAQYRDDVLNACRRIIERYSLG